MLIILINSCVTDGRMDGRTDGRTNGPLRYTEIQGIHKFVENDTSLQPLGFRKCAPAHTM